MGRKHPTVITHLEMLEAPARSVPRPSANLAIIRALMPPIHFYRYLYDTVGAHHVWVQRRRMDDAALRSIIQAQGVEIYVLHVDGCPAGFSELDFRESPEADLAYFGLIPEFTGRGLGSFFLAETVHIAWSRDIRRLTVQTCTLDHPAALPLYQRTGFSPYARSEDVLEEID